MNETRRPRPKLANISEIGFNSTVHWSCFCTCHSYFVPYITKWSREMLSSRTDSAICKPLNLLRWKPYQWSYVWLPLRSHYTDVIMRSMASQINGVSIVFSTVCLGADQRKHQSSAALAFVRGIHWWAVNSPHKGPVTRKKVPFDDVIMISFWNTNAVTSFERLKLPAIRLFVQDLFEDNKKENNKSPHRSGKFCSIRMKIYCQSDMI